MLASGSAARNAISLQNEHGAPLLAAVQDRTRLSGASGPLTVSQADCQFAVKPHTPLVGG